MQSRYYDPAIGRFISADGLLGETGDFLTHNMYAYCYNNPIFFVDINGRIPTQLFGAELRNSTGWSTSSSFYASFIGRVGISSYQTTTKGTSGIFNVYAGSTTDSFNILGSEFYAGVGVNLFDVVGVEYEIKTLGFGATISIFNISVSLELNLIGMTSITFASTQQVNENTTATNGVTIGVNTFLLIYTTYWIYKTLKTGDSSWEYKPAFY